MSGNLTRLAARALDQAAEALHGSGAGPAHLATGSRGEDEAYFHLRRLGYTMVARNYRSPHRRGEIDLIGWDGDVLCFIEVKTRRSRDIKPAEAAVDEAKRHELAAVARDYLRRLRSRAPDLPEGARSRFDVVSIYYAPQGRTPQISLFKNAFPMR